MRHERTKQVLARHEAAHFVIAWATGCPSYYVDITSAAQKVCDNDPDVIITGRTFGSCGISSPFEGILIDLAGPVADYWEQDTPRLLKGEQDDIDRALASIAGGEWLDPDDGDWDSGLRRMAEYGIDVLDKKILNAALSLFLDAVRSTLNSCETQWQEVTEHLVAHERIGFVDERLEQGDEAEDFFCRWEGDYGELPEAVKSCVEKFRVTIQAAGIAQKVELVDRTVAP